jgi:hypothetical protein
MITLSLLDCLAHCSLLVKRLQKALTESAYIFFWQHFRVCRESAYIFELVLKALTFFLHEVCK